MKRLRRFFSLTPARRHLLAKSAILLAAVRLSLWLLPFRVVRRVIAKMSHSTHSFSETSQTYTDQVAWSVSAIGRHFPILGHCLTQALATQALLGKHGQPVNLRIGVLRTDEGTLRAHAWVESQGRIIVGGAADISQYTPLPPLENKGT